MYSTTGFSRDDIVELCALISSQEGEAATFAFPPILGLFRCVVVTLTYLRRNRVQADLAETYGVSQSTISRAITALTPVLGRVLADYVPLAEDLPVGEQYIVDGTLLTCWSWAGRRELYSGKHHTTGLSVQVACDLAGRLRWVSDPVEGCWHDTAALRLSAVLHGHDTLDWIGDKGYAGNHMITPIKKTPARDMLDWEKEFNTALNGIRWKIEQTIAHLKTWRILHTDYRRPLNTFHQTISTVIALQFYRLAE